VKGGVLARVKVRTAPAAGDKGGESGSASAEQLEVLTKMSPKNGQAERLSRHDQLAEGQALMKEAGELFKSWLLTSPDSEVWDCWQDLTPGMAEAISATSGGSMRAIEAQVIKRTRDWSRTVEEERKKNLKRVKYPTVSRRAFDDLDRIPRDITGVIEEGRR
jgi:hypothetical protein